MEKKFWLVGLGVWFLLEVFYAYFGIFFGFSNIVFILFCLLQVAAISFVSSWLWKKWKKGR